MQEIILTQLEKLQPVVNILSLFLWFLYVLLTLYTFKQIKRQTDNQFRSRILIEAIERNNQFNSALVNENVLELNRVYEQHLVNFKIFNKKKFLFLKLQNVGKSNVINYKIYLSIDIYPGNYLKQNGIASYNFNWEIFSKGLIKPDCSFEIPVAETSSLPKAEFRWKIEYSDIIEENSSEIIGITNFQVINDSAYYHSNK